MAPPGKKGKHRRQFTPFSLVPSPPPPRTTPSPPAPTASVGSPSKDSPLKLMSPAQRLLQGHLAQARAEAQAARSAALNPSAPPFYFNPYVTSANKSSEFPSLGGGAPQVGGPSAATWGMNARTRSPERRNPMPYGRGMGRTQDEGSRGEGLPPGAEGYRFGSGQTNQTANRGSARSPFQAQEQEPIGYTGRQETAPPGLGNDGPASPPSATAPGPGATPPPKMKRISEMTDRERYGIAGLVARTAHNGPDYDPLLQGFDLTKLGINMDSNEPLINTYPTPFDDTNLVIPDFTVPPAYTVTNVPPLPSKLESFSDETLIMIFYQNPRDILQELAAQALYKRDWRWHTKMRVWMMKDAAGATGVGGYGGPVRLDEKRERGVYVLFDINNWRRERKDLVLNFDDLDTRPSLMQGTGLAGANAQTPAVGGGGVNGLGGGFAGGAVGGFGSAAFGNA